MQRLAVSIISLAIFAGILLSATPLAAQDSPWPERSENLQVLPDTTGAEKLRQTMLSFTRGLGVRCNYCHVGENGQPLSTFDFASDEIGAKRTARDMMRMVQMIGDTISGIDEGSSTSVTCMTCHKGQTKPPPQMENVILETVAEDGVADAVERFDELHERFYGRGLYDFSGRTFTRVARSLMEQDQPGDAVAFLTHGAKLYPQNPFIQSSLSDAYLAQGDTTMARLSIERAISLNPAAGFLREKLSAIASH